MITVILGVLLAVGIAIYTIYKERDEYTGSADYVFAIIISFLISGLFSFMLALLLPCKSYTEVTPHRIQSLQDNNQVKGSFFLGWGTIEGRMKYVFYVEGSPGYYHMEQLDCVRDNVTITYGDDPMLVTKRVRPFTIWQFGLPKEIEPIYLIVVPSGTIKNNYNLDAQ